MTRAIRLFPDENEPKPDGAGESLRGATPLRGHGTRRRWLVAPILAVCACGGPSRASLRVSVAPDPIQMQLNFFCGPLPAGCIPPALYSNWTVTVEETSGVGGRGVVTTFIVDPATGLPLPGQQGTVSGPASFVVGPNGSASLPQSWNWLIPADAGTPTLLTFTTTVSFTDSLNNTEAVMLPVSGVATGYTVP